jgi:hypothetical protein
MNDAEYMAPSTADVQQARKYIELAIDMVEKSQWLEERRDDVLRTLKYVNFYLGDRHHG